MQRRAPRPWSAVVLLPALVAGLAAGAGVPAPAPVQEASLGSAAAFHVVQSTDVASSCPEPSPCECHCDCQLTKVQKELPVPPPPPPPCAPAPAAAGAALISEAVSTADAQKGGISLAVEAVRRLRAAAASAGATRRATRRAAGRDKRGPPAGWEKEVMNTKKAKKEKKTWDKNHPNYGDTEWSQSHPECPMGKPCFCDCQCRGPPPQNFVNPPPPPCVAPEIDGKKGLKPVKKVDVDFGSSGLVPQ